MRQRRGNHRLKKKTAKYVEIVATCFVKRDYLLATAPWQLG